MPLELLVMRHGESTVNLSKTISNRVTDYAPLTRRGRQQSEELLNQLKDRKVIAVYSSPLMRATQTSEIIAAYFGLKVKTLEGLREPFCGEIEGRNDEEAWSLHAAQEKAWENEEIDFRIPAGESLFEVRQRFCRDINDIIEKHQKQTGSLVLVSHGSLMINTLPHFLTNISPAFARSCSLVNCSLVVAEFTEGGYRCKSWNGIPIA